MDLFLTSDDYSDFQSLRKIQSYHKTRLDDRDVLVVKVDIPIIGQKYGLGDYDPDTLYLLDKYDEPLLTRLSQFPINVYVTIVKERNSTPSSLSDLNNIAWASLYDNYNDAKKRKF